MTTYFFKLISLIIITLALGSCFSESSPNESKQSEGFSVNPFAAKIKGSACIATPIKNGSRGESIKSDGNGLSDDSGIAHFSTVSMGDMIIECSGGRYVDEATGEEREFTGQLTAVANVVKNSRIAVTPLTQLAYQRGGSDIKNSDKIINTYNRDVAKQFLGADVSIITIVPTDLSEKDFDVNDNNADNYAVVLAAISQIEKDEEKADMLEVIELLYKANTQKIQTLLTTALTHIAESEISVVAKKITATSSIKNKVIESIAVSAVSLAEISAINVGATIVVSPMITPANATNQAINFRSDNESVATVDVLGLVTGIKEGSANIKITTNDGSYTATKRVLVVDTDITKPIITLVGANPQTINTGSTYTELGATATDNKDGTITNSITIDASAVQINVAGEYTVTYNVNDSAGNSAIAVTRTVRVVTPIGYLIDSAIEGIKYVSGDISGYTDANGLFKYKTNTVTFYIGDETSGIPMGSATVKNDPNDKSSVKRKIITIFDLAGSQDENNQKVVNMGRFLQSLDSDKNTSNGITIDNRSKESIALLGLKTLNFDTSIEAFENSTAISNLFVDLATHFSEHRGLVAIEDAKTHMVAVRDGVLTVKTYAALATDTAQSTVILTGIFKSTDGVVEGLGYRSGGQFGRTNAQGVFTYEEGKAIKFHLAELEIGIATTKAVMTPADLVLSTSFNHPKPRNIIRLLKVFDAIDGDNKITIDSAVRESLTKYRAQIDLNLPDGRKNDELGIPAGEDEFGAQFDDFEIGTDILNEITFIRTGN